MSFDRLRMVIKKTLYERKQGPLPGNPESPTSSIYVVNELIKLGFVYDYLAEPAGQNTCFPTVHVYTTTHRDLPIERAIRLVHDSKPRQLRHHDGVITAWYEREPVDPEDPEHYKFFLGLDNSNNSTAVPVETNPGSRTEIR